MNPSTAIATPQQVSDKIEFTTFLEEWHVERWRDFIKADIRLRHGNTEKGNDGFAITQAKIDISAIAKAEMRPVTPGTLFKVTIERVS